MPEFGSKWEAVTGVTCFNYIGMLICNENNTKQYIRERVYTTSKANFANQRIVRNSNIKGHQT